MNLKKVVDILLVEDDAGDVELTREGLAAGKMFVHLHTVDDGIKALRFLRREEPYADAIRPDIILLDLNLPRMDGRATLKEIKSDERLRSIPVIVLTTSEADTDIFKCYDIGASCYISKPVGFQEFLKVVRSLEDFWFTIVKLPPKE
jgi:chemotaxis family two-component system response regulator Rcp1